MKNKKGIYLSIIILFLTFSCTAGANPLSDSPDINGDVAGFWKGLWHGFIVLISFIMSLFNDEVGIYELHNSGALYNLGYVIGVSSFLGSSGHAGKKAGRRD